MVDVSTIKVGDKLRVIKTPPTHSYFTQNMEAYCGEIGTVVEIKRKTLYG